MKRLRVVVISILLVTLFAGCGVPDMTPEQEARIVNYAANVALKYDAKHQDRLVDLSKYDTVVPSPSQEEEETSGMDPVEDTDIIDVSGGQGPVSSIDEFYELEELTIDYVDFQTCKTYPDGAVGDLYFSLDATPGNTLLLLQFNLTNVSAEDKKVDLISLMPAFRIQINGEKNVGVMQTMLLDDLLSYVGTLSAGETIPLVLLAEIDESYDGQISQIAIHMRKSSGGETQKLILLQ